MPTAVPMINSGGGLNIAQLIQAITPLLAGTGTTTTGGTTSQTQGQTGQLAIDPAINALLTSLFGQVQGGLGGFTKEQAISDSQAALQNLARTAVEQNMPSVLGGARAAGLYNTTTQDLLSNDLQARIAAQGAQLIQDNIAKYAAITGQGQQTAAGIGSTLAQGNRAQTQQNTQQTTQQQQQQTGPVVGGSARNNALAGLGITAGGTLLKNLPDITKLFGFGGGATNLGTNIFGDSGAINPGNMLNASYGFDTGIGGFAPSLGAALNLGSSATDAALGAGIEAGSNIFGNIPNFTTGLGEGLSGIFTNGGGAAPAAADTLSGLGGALSGGYNWLTDAFSGLGDFFGGFFSNGGMVPSKDEIHKKQYANGGQVTQRGAGEVPGRKGRQAYTGEAAGSNIYNISRALWEELQRGGQTPTLGDQTQVVTPGVNEGTANIMPQFRGPNPQLQQLVDNLRSQMQARTEAAEPTRLQQIEKGALQARGAQQQGGRIIDAATGVSPSTTLAAADLGGASSALSGSPIQQALAQSGAADLISAGAGAGAGAAATGAGLGTVDVLGSLAGTGAFLPTYGGAATSAGLSGAGGAFGGSAGTGGAISGGAAAVGEGISSALASTGVGAVAALLVNSFLPIIFGGFEGNKKSDEWIRAALDPAGTFNNDLVVGDMTANFFRDFYKGQGTGATTEARQSQYEAARQAINSDAFTTYIPGAFSSTGQASQGDYQGYFGAEDEAKARAAANYLNDQLYNNPEFINQLNQNPAIAPGALSANTSPGLALGLAQGGYTYPMLAAEEAGLPYPGYTPSTGNGAANGGMIGRDKSDPQGKADDILIQVSGGEYVVPKSVVDAVGSQFFDNLVDKFHVPFADRPPTR